MAFPAILTIALQVLLLLAVSCNGQASQAEWDAAYAKARTAVAQMTLAEKVNISSGEYYLSRCIGNTNPVASINFPGFCLEDSPLGVRLASNVSAFPPAINAAATFNRTLMRERGVAMGAEFRGKGVNVALGPMMNLMRAPAAGRNWEGFGADPFLSGEGAFETIIGIQSQGVQATAKHFINNEQEHFRTTSTSNVDDRTQHELYSIPFLRSVQAGVVAVMCSYNQINGTYACENDKTINGILKGEFGFQGYWGATHSTAPAVMAGLDASSTIIFWQLFFGTALVSAVQNGSVPESRIDDMATRVLAAWYLLGQDSGYPPVNFDSHNNNAADDQRVDVQGDHKVLIREIGKASTVLLKNVGGALPLRKLTSIGIIGNGSGPNSRGLNGCPDSQCDDGVLAMGWGSGTASFPYLITPLDAITARAAEDGTTVSSTLSDTDLDAAATVATGKDVALVFITADSGESSTVEGNAGDRNDLQAWHSGDALVQQVAKFNKNTIVVVNTVGPVVVEAWIDHPNVTALVWSGLPGQEAGNSVTDILFGAYNPSGRLPYTIGKSITDYSAQVIYTSSAAILPIPYSEGLFVDYKHFDAAGITPRFEFGFGLSFTTFGYSKLEIQGTPHGGGVPPTGPGSSLSPFLHDPIVTVKFTVKNTGSVAGHEIPQLYVALPASTASPPRMLKGFDSVFVEPGQSTQVTMQLSKFDFSFWNVVTQSWQVPDGKIGIAVGASSRDIRLNGSV
ncbi:glycoside hydrolase family 3 protein [Roridomyces roridus]|uniref:beta-glucosidase n=1 Tax=Roridomyces roridus TaxID=1738132 RepID=A0AAD7CAU6_9AGAR|nr:glycoside hydrolase family 3 protein [Roridomyces roridus]